LDSFGVLISRGEIYTVGVLQLKNNSMQCSGYEWFSERFGPLLGLDSAAGGSILNYDAVLKQDASSVLRKLQMEGARAAYQRRYQQLSTPKKD
jgi:hypothetical protein